MRLIDADELERVMTQDWFLEILATYGSKRGLEKNIKNAIGNVPTAYDVEKVEAELEELPYGKSYHEYAEKGVVHKYLERSDVLDIVRKGGVE